MQKIRGWFAGMGGSVPGTSAAPTCVWPYPKNVNRMVDGSNMPDWLSNRIQNAIECGACGKICQYDSKNTGYVLSQDGWTRVTDMSSNSACSVFPPTDPDLKCGYSAMPPAPSQVVSWQMCSDERPELINVPMLIVVLFALGVLTICSHVGSGNKRIERERVRIFFDDE